MLRSVIDNADQKDTEERTQNFGAWCTHGNLNVKSTPVKKKSRLVNVVYTI